MSCTARVVWPVMSIEPPSLILSKWKPLGCILRILGSCISCLRFICYSC